MKYRRFLPHFVLKSGIHGIGIFTTADIKKGSILHKLDGDIVEQPTRTSVQIGKHKHIEDEMAGLINHSCHPNLKIDRKNRALVSVRNIQKGEEIVFNYNENEDVLACPFICACCGRLILGKKLTNKTKSCLKKIILY